MSTIKSFHGEFLHVDLSQLARLEDLIHRTPAAMRKAAVQLINDLAFRARKVIPEVLAEKMIVRSPRFVQSMIRVQKAPPNAPLTRAQAFVGSIRTPRFSGWSEQEYGTDPKRSRVMSLFAAGGQKTGVVKPQYRLTPGKDIPSTDEAPVASGSRLMFLIRDMAKNAPNKPFIIKRGYGMRPGLYKIKSQKGYLLPDGRSMPTVQRISSSARSRRHHTRRG